jgi:argininosuccinate synthase
MKRNDGTQNTSKQRLTAFVDPNLVKRAKIRGALEELTLSEVVEKALEAYSPQIENDSDRHIHLKFNNGQAVGVNTSETRLQAAGKVAKRTKARVVPR